MKVNKDTKRALCALLPMILVMVTPMVATANASTSFMSSQGQLIDLLVADGYINRYDPIPLAVLLLVYGPYGAFYFAIGWRWVDLQLQMGWLQFPLEFAKSICKIVGAATLAAILTATGLAWIGLSK